MPRTQPPQPLDNTCMAIIKCLQENGDDGMFILELFNKIKIYKFGNIVNHIRYLELLGLIRKVKDTDKNRYRYYLNLEEFRVQVNNHLESEAIA